MEGLIAAGFPAIYPVNPNYAEVLGLKCYPGLRDIPGVVDHVIVTIPAESVLALLDDCIAKGIKSVHFFTAGFSESGNEERTRLEKAMLAKARAGGFRIFGPNCMGIFVPKNHLYHVVYSQRLEPGTIAFLSQSGGHTHDLPHLTRARGLKFSKLVSFGNALDVDESELLDYFAGDPDTEIIGAYLEGVKDGRRFLSALKKAAAVKPVVLYKGGTTEAGKRATRGHTASLTSSVAVFNSLCRQTHCIQVDDLDELVDAIVALRFANPIPRGKGVAVVGTGGGATVMASDEMEKAGLYLPTVPPQIGLELREYLPLAGSIIGNPIDARALLTRPGILAILGWLGKRPDIDMFVYHLGFHPATRWGRIPLDTMKECAGALGEVQRQTGKPVLVAMRFPPDLKGMEFFLGTQQVFVEAGFPVFHSLHKLALAAARVIDWKQNRDGSAISTQALSKVSETI